MLDFWKEIITTALRGLFGWPVAVVILGFALKTEVSLLLGRLTRLILKHGETSVEAHVMSTAVDQIGKPEPPGKGLIGTERDNEAQGVLNIVTAEDAAARQAMIDFGKNSPAVQVRERFILDQLAHRRFDLNKQETAEVLVRNLAFNQALATFEKAYRLIFGSQISLLKSLNAGRAQSDEEMRRSYSRARAKFAKFYSTYSYESWRDFLVGQDLIALDPANDLYGISDNGREFLQWLTGQGLSEKKYG